MESERTYMYIVWFAFVCDTNELNRRPDVANKNRKNRIGYHHHRHRRQWRWQRDGDKLKAKFISRALARC